MIRSWPSLLVGLGIPVVAVLGGVLALGPIPVTVLGFPLVFFWMFCCFPLTTACLWTAWWFFDRHEYREEPE